MPLPLKGTNHRESFWGPKMITLPTANQHRHSAPDSLSQNFPSKSRFQSQCTVSSWQTEKGDVGLCLTQLFHALDANLARDGSLVKAHDLSDVPIVSGRHLLTDHIVLPVCKVMWGQGNVSDRSRNSCGSCQEGVKQHARSHDLVSAMGNPAWCSTLVRCVGNSGNNNKRNKYVFWKLPKKRFLYRASTQYNA